MLRFACITDTHYGFDSGNKKGSRAPRLVPRFVKAANKNRVDFAVDLGDRVIHKNPEQDRYYLRGLREHFNALAVPYEPVMGNHDEWGMSRAENADILGADVNSRSKDIQGYHIIFWSPNVLGQNGFVDVRDEDLEWLRADLAATDKPTILLHHIPIDCQDAAEARMANHPFFTFYARSHKIRQILEESGKVKLSICGHRHRNRIHEINGITYITQQSLTQKMARHSAPYGAFAIYEVDDDSALHVRRFGRGQRNVTIKLS